MARITTMEVEQIMDLSSDVTDQMISSFITAANSLVTKVLGDDTTLTSELKKEIEKWLTAHMIAMTPHGRQAQVERLGEARIDYVGKYGEGLKQTTFGQTVLTLDISGKMATAGGKKRAFVRAIDAWDHGDS